VVDSKALANLILELNISRRNSRSYPKGHQVIDAALNKVLNSYAGLRKTGEEIVIGVACDALLLGDTPLEKTNLIYRDFARVLYERGIGALVLRRELTLEELRSFIAILGTEREEIYRAGGIGAVWESSGIAALGIREIRYDLFTATEEAAIAAFEHHAKLNLSGYPKFPADWRLNLCSHLTMISDFFDATRTRRSYREPLALDEITTMMLGMAGSELHPVLTRNFIHILYNLKNPS